LVISISGLYIPLLLHIYALLEKGDYIINITFPVTLLRKRVLANNQCDESGNNVQTTYYSSMQRIESNLARVCGSDSDISTCVLAGQCMEGEAGCSIKLCNPNKDTCAK